MDTRACWMYRRWSVLGLLLVMLTAGFAYDRGDAGKQDRSSAAEVVPGVVVVKLRQRLDLPAGASKTGVPFIDAVSRRHRVYAVEQAFPFLERGAAKAVPAARQGAQELLRIYLFRYEGAAPPGVVAAELARAPEVAYAEPLFAQRLTPLPEGDASGTGAGPAAMPNDPRFGEMTYLERMQLPEAWDVVRGAEGAVIVAVVDGGADWQHEDLQANVWTNPGEIPGNGLDDDANGFVDDVHGWNFAIEGPDPTGLAETPGNARHGTAVAGTVAAVTDNGLGMAGTSWNARFMPVNVGCSEQDNLICYGYAGILYAALNGASVINASWGGGDRSNLAEDVINTAHVLGALVVTSAGNGGQDGLGDNNDLSPQYPANYRHVLAVGATVQREDRITSFSNYGRTVDVYAPGQGLTSTLPNNQYTSNASGTSFSAPLVAGVAALVKTQHPDWSVDQVREQVRVTSDDIDALNPGLEGLLGKGRVNALRAVTETGLPAVRVARTEVVESGEDDEINRGETARVRVFFTNFLAPASDITVSLTTEDPAITILGGTAALPALSAGDTAAVTFTFSLSEDTPDQYILRFITEIDVDGHTDVDVFDLIGNPPVTVTLDTGVIQTSLTAQGNIGWTGFAGESAGVGFVFNGRNQLFEGGLLVATSSDRISDSVRGPDGVTQDEDFMPASESTLRLIEPGEIAHLEGVVTLVDAPAPSPIGVTVLQETFADTTAPHNSFIIHKYTITNVTTAAISDLYGGLFFDWDLNEDAQDFARYEADRRLGIVQDAASSPSTLVATKLLTARAAPSYRSIHNPNELYDGFTDAEKWAFLSGGIQRQTAGPTDVSHLMGAGPYTVKAGCSVEVAFASVVGTSPSALLAHADAAQAFWDEQIQPLTPNRPPVFTAVPGDQTIDVGQAFTFTFEAADPDSCDVLRFSLVEAPEHATLDADTGMLVFMPGCSQVGSFTFKAVVSDGRSADTTHAMITVAPQPNQAPVFSRTLADTTITSEQVLTFTFEAADPNPCDTLQFSLLEAPPNASIVEAGTGTLRFAPEQAQLGTFRFTMVVSDGQAADTTRAEVTVLKANQAPAFSAALRDTAIVAGQLLTFAFGAADPDDQMLHFSLVEAPTGAAIHAQTGAFTFTPGPEQTGTHAVVVAATDGELSDTTRAIVTVLEATFELAVYPSPGMPPLKIEYRVARTSAVTIRVYDVLGRAVRTLVQDEQGAGPYQIAWDGTNDAGQPVASGLYFYRLTASSEGEHVSRLKEGVVVR